MRKFTDNKNMAVHLIIMLMVIALSGHDGAAVITDGVGATGTIPFTPQVVLDDFNTDSDINRWNCRTGAFGSLLTATTNPGYCTRSWDSAEQALKLDYDVRNLASFSGYTSQMGGGNLTSLGTPPVTSTAISFYVKGEFGGEFFKVQLKNTSTTKYTDNPKSTYYRNSASVYVNDFHPDGRVTTDWKKVTIPLHNFANLDGFSSMKEFVIVFEGDQSRSNGIPAPKGAIYIDNIQFETAAVTTVKVSSFEHKIGVCALGGSIGDFDPVGNTYPTNPSARHSISDVTYTSSPYSMLSEYTVNPHWAGHCFIFGGGNDDSDLPAVGNSGEMGWIAVPHDFTGFNSLNFSVRALATGQNPVVLKIELVDKNDKRYVRIGLITDSWQPCTIDLTEFPGLDKTSIKQMNIVYEDWVIASYGGNKVGGVYIDDIRFE